jgi:hypothetical protein
MPRYYFNLRDEVSVEDSEGKELANLDAARDQAIVHARGMMAEDIRQGRLMLGDQIDVIDEQGQRVLTVAFREAIAIQE